MKKSNLFLAMTASVLAFSACSKTESGIVPENDGEAQQIVLQVANGGDLTTRAGRPMYGSEAKQTIENVKLIICDASNQVVYAENIANWNTNQVSTPYSTGGHGREKVVELKGENKLPGDATYTVYAIGYHNSSDYTNINEAVVNIQKGGKFSENVQLTLNQAAGNKIGEEIFAGSLKIATKTGKGFKTPVVLNRQVAGVFGYVHEIPFFEGATNLKLVASARNTGLVLGHFANEQIATNGGAANVNYVINGETPADDKVLFDIKLSDWFTAIKADKNGMIDTTTWKNPLASEANFKKGSVFGGNFVTPFAKASGNTLILQLTKGTEVLREWIVKLPASDKQLKEHDLLTWKTNNFASAKNTDNSKVYNIVRNHLYGIGTRNEDKPVDPDKPNPEPTDPDEPESLNNKHELVLQVNDNWEVIHKMELE